MNSSWNMKLTQLIKLFKIFKYILMQSLSIFEAREDIQYELQSVSSFCIFEKKCCTQDLGPAQCYTRPVSDRNRTRCPFGQCCFCPDRTTPPVATEPWPLLFCHRPPFPSATTCADSTLILSPMWPQAKAKSSSYSRCPLTCLFPLHHCLESPLCRCSYRRQAPRPELPEVANSASLGRAHSQAATPKDHHHSATVLTLP
jgi:hypothetical protein